MVTRAIFAFAALAAILAGAGCKPAGDSANSPAPASSGQHPKVALVMKSLANNFFATMAEGARRHQAEHAADYELSIAGIKNETDLNEQVNLVEQAVAQGAAAIAATKPVGPRKPMPIFIGIQIGISHAGDRPPASA